MTQNAHDTALLAPPRSEASVTTQLPELRPSVGRLIGVDLARGLAVFGMYAAHVGPDPSEGGSTGFFMELAHGRASALFAFLAGFSIVLITGRRTPKTGRAGRQAVAKVVIRALILLVLGTALTLTGTPVEVILAFYGLYFLLVLPLYRLGARPLAVIAVSGALILPQILYVVQQALNPGGGDGGGPGGIWAWPTDADGIVSLLFTGGYPALAWIPFVVAGMAVARLDLASAVVRTRLAITGVSLAVLGYGGSFLALHLVPGAASALRVSGWGEEVRSCRPGGPTPRATRPAPLLPGCWRPRRTPRRPSRSWPTPAWPSRSWPPASPPPMPSRAFADWPLRSSRWARCP